MRRLARIEPRQIEQMRALIRQMARRLRERFSKPRKRQRRGHLDVRRTLRSNAAWGSVPFLTAWKRKHRDKPKIVALCDVSGSVARVSDFLPAVDPQPARSRLRRPLLCFFRAPDRGQRHPRSQRAPTRRCMTSWARSASARPTMASSLRRFRAAMDGKRDAADHRDRARRRAQQQSRSRRRHHAAHFRARRSAWSGSIPRDA